MIFLKGFTKNGKECFNPFPGADNLRCLWCIISNFSFSSVLKSVTNFTSNSPNFSNFFLKMFSKWNDLKYPFRFTLQTIYNYIDEQFHIFPIVFSTYNQYFNMLPFLRRLNKYLNCLQSRQLDNCPIR